MDQGAPPVPGAPVGRAVILTELQQLHPAKLLPLRNSICLAAVHHHHVTGDTGDSSGHTEQLQPPLLCHATAPSHPQLMLHKQNRASLLHADLFTLSLLSLTKVGPVFRGLRHLRSLRKETSPFWACRSLSSCSRSSGSRATRLRGAKTMFSLISKGANFPQEPARV